MLLALLQHLGEFHDNVSRDRLIGLMVGEGGSQYQLGQGEAPVDNESKWRLPLFYPVQVPFELEGAEGEQNVRVWYRQDNGTLLDNRSVTVNLDYSPPSGLPLLSLSRKEAGPMVEARKFSSKTTPIRPDGEVWSSF